MAKFTLLNYLQFNDYKTHTRFRAKFVIFTLVTNVYVDYFFRL